MWKQESPNACISKFEDEDKQEPPDLHKEHFSQTIQDLKYISENIQMGLFDSSLRVTLPEPQDPTN